jgi:hypothetical protein
MGYTVNTATFNQRSLTELLNFLLRNYNTLKAIIDAGGGSGSKDSVLSSTWIPSYAFLPYTSDSAYYVEAESPAYVFEPTTKSSVKLIFNEGDVVDGAVGFKIKFETFHDASGTPTDLDVVWEVSAGWYIGDVAPIMGDAVLLTQTLDDDDEKTAISAASSDITIGGEKTTDDKFQVLITRDGANELDDLDANAFLTRVHFEFVTA